MKTNEQIAERWARLCLGACDTQHRRGELFQQYILGAINEAATPQWDESEAVDWPTINGQWLERCGNHMRWVWVWQRHDGKLEVADSAGKLHRPIGATYLGPFTPPLPSPPAPPAEPDVWDWKPTAADHGKFAWISGPEGQWPSPMLVSSHISGYVFVGALRVDDNGYRFAKATVEPPPTIGGDS